MAEPKRFFAWFSHFLFLVFEEEIVLDSHSVPGFAVNLSRGVYEIAALKITDVGFGEVVIYTRCLIVGE